MDDNEKEKSFELFDNYTALLNQKFFDAKSTQHMQERCIAIATELHHLGFYILISAQHTHDKQKLPSGERQNILTLEFTCSLIHNPPADQTPIAVSTAISKIFGPLIPAQNIKKAPLLPTTHVSEEDKEWLKSSGIAWDAKENE